MYSHVSGSNDIKTKRRAKKPTCNDNFLTNLILACEAGAKRGREGGVRKARQWGKGKGALPSLPNPPPFFPSSLSPTPFDAC